MLAAILEEPGRIVLKEVPEPEPDEGEVVIKVVYALTDGTDLKAFRRGHHLIGSGPFGHEYSGIIYRTGKGVSKFREGDAIMGVNTAPCMECHFCRLGKYSLCENLTKNMVLGAYAQYLKIPARVVETNLFHKPDEIPFKVAPILEPLSCVLRGIENLGRIGKEESILIAGTGAVGAMFSILLSEGHRVYVAGRRDEPLKFVKELSPIEGTLRMDEKFEEKAMEITGGYGFDVVIDATGSPDVINRLKDVVSKGGKYLIFSGVERGVKVEFDIHRIHYGEISVMGSFHHTPTSVRKGVEVLREKHELLEKLITHELPLRDIERAFAMLLRKEAIKIAINPWI